MLHVFSQNRQSASAAEHLKGTDGCNTLINHTHTVVCVVYQLRHLKKHKKKSENQLLDLYILKLVSVCFTFLFLQRLESKLKAELVFIFRLNLHDLLVVFFFFPRPTFSLKILFFCRLCSRRSHGNRAGGVHVLLVTCHSLQ